MENFGVFAQVHHGTTYPSSVRKEDHFIDFSYGRRHNFRLIKRTKVKLKAGTTLKVDMGFIDVKGFHAKS